MSFPVFLPNFNFFSPLVGYIKKIFEIFFGDFSVASAPGKVLITGGYLILERPNAGLVFSTNARFYAIVKPLYGEIKPDSWAWVSAAFFLLAYMNAGFIMFSSLFFCHLLFGSGFMFDVKLFGTIFGCIVFELFNLFDTTYCLVDFFFFLL